MSVPPLLYRDWSKLKPLWYTLYRVRAFFREWKWRAQRFVRHIRQLCGHGRIGLLTFSSLSPTPYPLLRLSKEHKHGIRRRKCVHYSERT